MLHKLKVLFPNSVNFRDYEIEYHAETNSFSIVKWNLPDPQPTQAQLDAVTTQAQALEIQANAVANRISEYGTIAEQLDMMYWDSINGTTSWKDHIAQVKLNNPK